MNNDGVNCYNCSKIHFKNLFYKELTPHYSMYVRRIY